MLFSLNPESSILQNCHCKATYLPSHKLSQSDKQDMQSTTGEVKMNS